MFFSPRRVTTIYGFAALLLCLVQLASALAKDIVVFPKDFSRWRTTKPAEYDSAAWREANDSDRDWEVSRRGTGVVVKLRPWDEPDQPLPFEIKPPKGSYAPMLRGQRYVTMVNNGWIVGFNAGEWGGTLWWFSSDGRKKYMISKDQVSGFFPSKAGLLAIEGLAHMSIDKGRIIRLRQNRKGRWATERFVDLKHAPYAAALDSGGSLIVATSGQLLRVHPNKTIDVILNREYWSGLYPDSMAIAPSGTIYLGMRYAVARMRRSAAGYKVDWITPQ